jgi:hypothetical protein
MSEQTKQNEYFLRNIYNKGPFQGHGFVCTPPQLGCIDHPDYDYTLSDKPVQNWVPQVVENYMRQVAYTEALGDDNIPCARLTTGTHIYAAAFGCQVHQYPDTNAAAQPLVWTADEADPLAQPSIWNSPTLYRVFELAHAVQANLGKDVWLGPPDIQTGFDTAALVWNKEGFLQAMTDPLEKEAVKRLAGKCAGLLKAFIIEFRKEFPRCSTCHCPAVWCPPELGPWVSNDECGVMSTRMFEEFCLPELIDLSLTFGSLAMHCCADAEHQFQSFKRIPHFYAFNRVAARRGYSTILEPLGGTDGPVHVLGWVSAEETEVLMQHPPAGTRFIFNLLDASLDDSQHWLDRMRQISPRTVSAV